MQTLVMFSGGIDSTAALLYALKEETHPVHVHHVRLQSIQERHVAEKRAVGAIYQELLKTYGDRLRLTETTVDFSAFGIVPHEGVWLACHAASICRVQQGGTMVFMGRSLDDLKLRDADLRIMACHAVFAATLLDMPKKRCRLIEPLIDKSKRHAIDYIGDLVKLTWSCRTPIRGTGDIPVECGQCHACLQRKELGLWTR